MNKKTKVGVIFGSTLGCGLLIGGSVSASMFLIEPILNKNENINNPSNPGGNKPGGNNQDNDVKYDIEITSKNASDIYSALRNCLPSSSSPSLSLLNSPQTLQTIRDSVQQLTGIKGSLITGVNFEIVNGKNNLVNATIEFNPTKSVKMIENDYFSINVTNGYSITTKRSLLFDLPITIVGNNQIHDTIQQYIDKYKVYNELVNPQNLDSLYIDLSRIFGLTGGQQIVNINFIIGDTGDTAKVSITFNNIVDLNSESFILAPDGITINSVADFTCKIWTDNTSSLDFNYDLLQQDLQKYYVNNDINTVLNQINSYEKVSKLFAQNQNIININPSAFFETRAGVINDNTVWLAIAQSNSKYFYTEISFATSNYIIEGTVLVDISESAKQLTKIDLSGMNITEIGPKVFENNTTLTSIIFPEKLTTIGVKSFSGCKGLQEIDLPKSLRSIGAYAFDNCVQPLVVNFAPGCELINIGERAFNNGQIIDFANCKFITKADLVELSETNPNAIFSKGDVYVDILNLSTLEASRIVDGVLTIPEKINTLTGQIPDNVKPLIKTIDFGKSSKVNKMPVGAFSNCVNLETVTMPSQLKVLENNTFFGCVSLKNINFKADSQLQVIGSATFYDCNSLTDFEFPSKVTSIGGDAFSFCTKLTNVIFPRDSQLSVLDGNIFRNCIGLKSINIPDSVTEIGDGAFANCSNLTSIQFSDNSRLRIFGKGTFANCISLQSILIPAPITSIQDNLFNSCINLKNVEFAKGSLLSSITPGAFPNGTTIDLTNCLSIDKSKYIDIIVNNGQNTFINNRFNFKVLDLSTIKTTDLIGNKLVIQHSEYDGISGTLSQDVKDVLQGIEFGAISNVLFITNGAFSNCDQMTTVTMPRSIQVLGPSIFEGCSQLSTVTFEEGTTQSKIFNKMFKDCTSLTTLTIPTSITEIEESAFEGCSNLQTLSLTNGNNEVSVGNKAFKNCTNLTNPGFNAINYIGDQAFYNCTKLSGNNENTLNISAEIVGTEAFSQCNAITNINFTKNVNEIKNQAFSNCSKLTNVTFNGNVDTIGDQSFQNCQKLNTVTFNNDVTQINTNAFSNCTKLTNVLFNGNVETIGTSAFSNCSKLSNVNYAKTINTIGTSAFENCSSLIAISTKGLSKSNNLQTIGENAFKNSGITNLTIPSTLTTLGQSAFANCMSLNSVGFDSNLSLHTITNDAFINSGVKTVDISSEIRTIGENAFANCRQLTEVTLNEGTTTIEPNAFKNSAISSITIPNSIVNFGDNAFSSCNNLTSATINSNIESLGNGLFKDSINLSTINLGANIKNITNNAFENTGFTTLTLPASVANIDNSAFANCQKLTTVSFENPATRASGGLTNIGNSAFSSCPVLTQVNLPSTLLTIGNSAFKDSVKLSSIGSRNNVFNNSIQSIGNDAFNGTGLTQIKLPRNIKSIGARAFSSIDTLTEVTLQLTQESVILDQIFSNCTRLTKATISDSTIDEIGTEAFGGCINLQEISIVNSSINTISGNTFKDCNQLATFSLDNSQIGTIANSAFKDSSELSTVSLTRSNISSINTYAFANCTKLATLKLEGNSSRIYSVGDNAFEGCTSLSSIDWANHATNIGNYAFKGCTSLTELKLQLRKGLTLGVGAFQGSGIRNLTFNSTFIDALPENFFADCDSLETINFDNTQITTIENNTFGSCESLLTVNATNNSIITNFGGFQNATKLKSVIFDNTSSISTLTNSAFDGCTSLNTVDFKNTAVAIADIGNKVFNNCNQLNVLNLGNVPDVINNVGEYAFNNCNSLPFSGDIQQIVTNSKIIGQYGFAGCTNWNGAAVTLTNATSIGDHAFNGSGVRTLSLTTCTSKIDVNTLSGMNELNDVTITNSDMESINANAASNCPNLANLTITNSSLGTITGFKNLNHLNTVRLDNINYVNLLDDSFRNTSMQTLNISNSNWENIRGFNNNSNLRNLTFNATTITNFDQNTFANSGYSSQFEVYLTNGSTVSNLGGFANSNISKLDINNSTITTILDNAFLSSNNLKTINITNSSNITTIGKQAFMNCSKLAILNIDNLSGISRIDNRAFKDCDLGTTFYLSDNIKSIGDEAFNSTNIHKAIIPTNLTSLGTGVYANCRENISVDFRRNSRITSIPDWTFYENINLREVKLPTQINSIGAYAFKVDYYTEDGDNDGIQTINLNNITTLKNNCFQNSAITSYSITNKIGHIPDYAFDGCTMMTSINLNNPRTFSIGECAFKNTIRLNGTKTNFNNITTIGDSAFEESGINSHPVFRQRIEIQSIGNRAFYHCNKLENFPFTSSYSYTFNAGTIGDEAFAYANLSLMGKKSNGISNSLQQNFSNIGVGAFAYSGIKSVDINSFNFKKNFSSIPSECFKGLGNNPEYPANNAINISFDGFNIKNIGSSAFREMNNLKHSNGFWNVWLICNDGVEYNLINIGEYAFADCKSYLDIAIPSTLSTIDNYAFYNTDIFSIDNDRSGNTYWNISVGNYAFAHSDDWNNKNARSIRVDGSECYLGTFINRVKTVGDYAFYNIGGSAPGNITAYSNLVKRRIMVWNQDRYTNIKNVGVGSFKNNMFDKDPRSGYENSGHWAPNIISIGGSGFENVFIADNTSFISPYGVREFQNNNKIVTIREWAFNNFAIVEHDKNNYFKFAISLQNVGYCAFTAKYKTDKYIARVEFYNNQWYTLNDSVDAIDGINISFVNYSERTTVKFNDAYFSSLQKKLLNKLIQNFNGKQGYYNLY